MDVYLWAGLCIGCLIIEALTVNLVSIWFAVGALLSMIAAAAGLNGAWQLGIFCIGSAVMIAGLRPMAKRLLKKNKGRAFKRRPGDRKDGRCPGSSQQPGRDRKRDLFRNDLDGQGGGRQRNFSAV